MLERLESLIGKDNIKKIKNANILLVGLGGVGGIALEALVRSGVEHITVIDKDTFEESNLNRQILSSRENIGNSKVDEAIKYSTSINSNIKIKALKTALNEENIGNLDKYDYIIDAIDDINAKKALIRYAINNNIKIIISLGTGKRLDPSKVVLTTLNKTEGDPLARKLRYELRKDNISLNIPVVYSKELPLNNKKEVSSSIFVPSTAGLYLAYYVINDIIK